MRSYWDYVKRVSTLGVVILSLAAFTQCSSSGSSDEDDGGGGDTEAGTTDAQAASGTSSGLGTLIGGTASGVSESETVASAIKAAIKGRVANQTIEFDESIEISCEGGGSVTNTASGSVTIDESTESVTLDLTGTASFDSCVQEGEVTLEDGSECDFNVTMDGSVTCSIEGTASETEVELTISCSTEDNCSGMTVTVNGEEHTVGMSASATITDLDSGEPVFDSDDTVCIDGVEYTFEELEAFEAPAEDITCTDDDDEEGDEDDEDDEGAEDDEA